MPIFDKDVSLFSEPLESMPEQPEVYTGKALPDVPVFQYKGLPEYKPMFGNQETSGDVYDFFAKNRGKKTDVVFGPSLSELKQNQRYDFYKPGVDYEDIYGRTQSFWSQIGNGFAKAGIRAVGAFAQSFYTIPDDIAAIKNGDMNRLLGGEDMHAMDDWIKNTEELFPNYYSRYERDHPFTSGLGNIIGDKIISNLGFTVGTIGSSVVQNAILDAVIASVPTEGAGAIPGAIFGAGTGLLRGIGKASLVLSKIFSGTNKLEKVLDTALDVGRTGEQVLNLKKLVELNTGRNALVKAFDGTRYAITSVNAAQSEGVFEGRQGAVQIREALINEYKNTHNGESPTGTDLKVIEDNANSGGLAILAGNMPLLLISNAVQLDGILKSFSKAAMESKIIGTQLGELAIKEGTIDEVEKVVAKDIYGKIWNAVKTPAKNILTEGVYEEGGQYAVSQGVADYYTNKYKNKDSASIVNSAIKGLSDQFTTSEGIENMVIGGITGGLFGIVEHAVEKRFGKTDAKLNTIISELNNSKISGSFAEKYDNTARSVEIAKQMQDAAKSNDIRKFKNLKADLFFTKVMQRINMGMHDVTIEQLEMMRDLPKDQFENMFGVDFNTSNKQTVDQYVDKLISTANEIKQTSESVDNAFKNPFTYINDVQSKEDFLNNQKYNIFEQWKLDIKNFSFSKQDRNNRLNDIQSELIKLNPLLNNALVGSLLDNNQLKALSDSYSEDASIKEEGLSTVPSNERAQVRSDIKKLRTVSEKINMALSSGVLDPKLFEELINLEINNRDFSKPGDITFDKIEKLMSYSSDISEINKEKSRINDYIDVLTSEGGFKKYFEDREKEQKDLEEDVEVVDETKPLTHIFKNHEDNDEQAEVGREYETTKVKLVKPKKEGSKYKVIAPDGKTTYFDTRKEALTHAKEINADISDLAKIKVLALNEDGTVKVEDINGNIQNINPYELEGYKRLQTQQEQLAKDKDVINAEQEKLELVSGTVPTISETTESPEGKLKEASQIFKSTTSESEEWSDPTASAPHVKRSRIFLNSVARFKNRKNYKVILITPTNAANAGLDGIVQLSYGNSTDTPISEIPSAVDINDGFMAQVYVYVDKSGSYFVNEKGEKIGKVGEQIPDIANSGIVFQTMPAAKLYDSKGNPRFRKNQEEQANKELAAYKIFREQKFKDDSIGQAYPFKVSRGVRRKTETVEENHIQDILGENGDKIISSDPNLLEVVTTGKVEYNGELLSFPNGTVVFKYGNILDFANNKKLTPTQALNIFSVIEALSNSIVSQSEKGQRVNINNTYSTFLQNVLYWKSKSDTTSDSQIRIDVENMSIKIGNKSFEIANVSDNKEQILEALGNAFFSVNNKTLKDGITNSFVEYVANPNGKPTAIVWKNYQEYLLSNKYPNGKSRPASETPLITRAPKPTDLFPSSYIQRYSTIEDGALEFPYELVKEEVKEAPKKTEERKYNLKPGVVNGFKLNDGRDILFTGEKTDGKYIITIQKNKTLEDLVGDANIVNSVRSSLESVGISTSEMNSAQVIDEYLQTVIIQDIERQSAQPVVEEKVEETPEVVEEKTVEETEAPVDFSKFKGKGKGKGKNTKFRRVGISDSAKMTEEELEAFKKWHAENIPNIPFEILEQMIVTNDNRTAWGVFENDVAKFVRDGLKGTEYHEIFEGIWANLLTETEKNNILNEFRAQKGEFIDRETGKEYSYSDPEVSDEMIKERIADDFADYRLGKLKVNSLTGRIKEFFKRIMDFFKSFIAKKTKEKSLKDQLFDAINRGELKERPNIGKSDIAPQYRIQGLSEEVVNDLVQDMVGQVAEIIYGQKEYTKQLLFNPEQISGKGIFNEIRKNMEDEGIIEFIGEDRYNKVQERALEYLRTLGVSFDVENDINNEESNQNDYAPEAFSVDWKKTSTAALRFSLATIPQRLQKNQKGADSLVFPEDADGNMFVLSTSLGEYGGYKLVDFNRVFATLLDKLSNTTSVEDFTKKLVNLAETDTTYLAIFARLGGNLATKSFDFNTFETYDWKYFVQFYNLFTKQKPEALIQYIQNGEVYVGSANLFSATTDVIDSWINNIKTLSKSEDSIIRYNKAEKLYKIDSEKIKSMPIRKPENMVALLEKIGIDFPIGVYNLLSSESKIVGGNVTSEREEFTDAVRSIHSYLGKNNNLMTIKEDTLDISGPLRKLARLYVNATNPNQDSTYFGVLGQRIGTFSENNAPSLFEDDFNESDTLKELLEKRPELNGWFSQNSQILKKGGLFFDEDGNRIAQIKVETIQGTKNLDSGRNKSIAKLTLGERFTQEINQNIQGKYYVLVPGDGSTEWMMNLGNVISFEEVQSGTYTKKLNEIFKGYLVDEVKLALYGDSKTLTVKAKSKELRFMKDILSEKDVTEIEKLLSKEDTTFEDVESYIDDNIKSINSAIEEFISNVNNKTLEQLTSTGQIGQDLSNKKYTLSSFDSEFIKKYGLESVNEEQLNNFLKFININYIINNTEYHKFIFGDPYQFKIKNGNLDETKRIKAFLSPRRRLFDLSDYDTFLKDNYNKVGEVSLNEDDVTYHEFKSYTKTATLTDLNILGSVATSDLPESIKSQYGDVDETDAMSWLGDNTYREIKLKSGQWSDQAEEWHQWQMAWTRQNLPGYEYKSEALRKLDEEKISKPAPPHHIEVIKPIVSGNKANKTDIDIVLDKFSQMPLYYSMVKGTNLEQLYLKMKKEGIGYVIAQSGRKVGSEGNNNIYNQDGSFNTEEYTNTIDVPWKSYGIIVETASEGEKQQTRGSQLTKIISSDLFANGEVAEGKDAARVKKAYEENLSALNDLNEFAYNEFLNKLGVEYLGGEFVATDGKKISETLMYEMLRRDVSENVKDTIKTDQDYQFLIPFEASPSYEQIRNIIYSMVNKALISPKMNGAPHVQVPATMFETGNRKLARKVNGKWQEVSQSQFEELSPEEKKSVVITDNSLKFYSKKNPYCEIMLPAWFKKELKKGNLRNASDKELIKFLEKTEEGKKILSGIGFRIPTQALSSVERFRVKGFLPEYMGYTVAVPSEITKKAGSDFDIDKLNIYLKSVYTDASGNLRLVDYKGSEQETFDFYKKMYDMISEKKDIRKSDMIEAIDIVLNDMDDPKNLKVKYGDYIRSMREKFSNVMDLRDELERQLVKKTDEEFYSELRENYAKEKYKQALENRYYESLEELMDIQGLERILSPVDDAGLEGLSKELDNLRGYNESSIKGRLLDRTYMTKLRHDFITGKTWVGIAAVNITGLSLRQKTQVYLDPKKISLLSAQDRKFVTDLDFALDVNKVNVDGQTYVSLSGLKTADGTNQFLSDRFSGYATSFVDIAANPYIAKIIKSDVIVSTFMFLEAVGAGNQGVMFLNQPIIDKYLKILEQEGTKNVKNKDAIKKVRNMFPANENDIKNIRISKTGLADNIKEYYQKGKLNNVKNAEQQKILSEFIKYKILADQFFNFSQAINYDTTRFTSQDILYKKDMLFNEVRNKSVITNVEKVLQDTFIGKLRDLLGNSAGAIGSILKLDNPKIRAYTLSTLKRYATKPFMSSDDYEKISNLIRNSFLDYIIQTNSTLNNQIEPLLVNSDTNIAVRLQEMKAKYPSVKILQEFDAVSSNREGGATSIKLKTNVRGDVFAENYYTGLMRELRDSNKELNQFYRDIINTSILQGTSQTAISFRNIIPVEDYSETITPIINQLQSGVSLKGFEQYLFERNNFSNENVFETVSPGFVKNTSAPNHYEIPMFINVPGKAKAIERKVIKLSEKYNARQIGSDFVKMPKIVKTKVKMQDGEMGVVYVDVLTGNRITPADFEAMKKSGDTSLNSTYYYAKVYTDQFNEFGEKLPLRIFNPKAKGPEDMFDQVYKLINVYGDGNRAAEHPNANTRSVINNGGAKTKQELTDDEIVKALLVPSFEKVIGKPMNEIKKVEDITENLLSLPSEEDLGLNTDLNQDDFKC